MIPRMVSPAPGPSASQACPVHLHSADTSLTCRQDSNNQRTKFWTAIATDESEYQADPLLKGLATYGLAFDACKAENTAEFQRLIKRSQEHWTFLKDNAMLGFITRNLERGVCPQCVQEMTGIMDGCEMRFKQFIETHIAMQEKVAAATANAAKGGKAAAATIGAGSSKGARLIPGGGDDGDEKAVVRSASGLRVASSMQQAQAGIQGLREEMKKGYQLYDDQQYAPTQSGCRCAERRCPPGTLCL